MLAVACGAPESTPTAAPMPTPTPATEVTPTPTPPPANGVNDPVARGQMLVQNQGCVACHSTDGTTLVGPTWQGVYGHEVTLADGTTVVADEEYLRESIVDPNAQIVEGFFPGIMPGNYRDMLSDEDIDAIIAYIRTLQ
jgi:mono/diheme cytochrome c family protein